MQTPKIKKILAFSLKVWAVTVFLLTISCSQPDTASKNGLAVFAQGRQIRIDPVTGTSLVYWDNKIVRMTPQDIQPQTLKEFQPTQKIIISRDGNLAGVLNRVDERDYTFELRKIADLDHIIFKIVAKTYHTFLLAPGGNFVVGTKRSARLQALSTTQFYTFYSAQGEVKATVGPFKTRKIKFSPDGSALVLHTRDEDLTAWGMEGERLWQVRGNFRHFAISNGAEFMAASADQPSSALSIYARGSLYKKIQLQKRCLRLTLSANGRHAVLSDRDSLLYIDIIRGIVKWQRAFQGDEKAVSSLSVSRQGFLAFSTEKKIAGRGNLPDHFGCDKLFLYSPEGIKLMEKPSSYGYFEAGPPVLAFSAEETPRLYTFTLYDFQSYDCNQLLKIKKSKPRVE